MALQGSATYRRGPASSYSSFSSHHDQQPQQHSEAQRRPDKQLASSCSECRRRKQRVILCSCFSSPFRRSSRTDHFSFLISHFFFPTTFPYHELTEFGNPSHAPPIPLWMIYFILIWPLNLCFCRSRDPHGIPMICRAWTDYGGVALGRGRRILVEMLW